MSNKSYDLIIGRLVKWYWPSWLTKFTLCRVLRASPREYIDEMYREMDLGYDSGRIHFLLRQIRSGIRPDPIVVDMTWHRWGPSGIVVMDGHHRLVASVLARKRRIPASFGGLVDMRRWMTGELSRCPM